MSRRNESLAWLCPWRWLAQRQRESPRWLGRVSRAQYPADRRRPHRLPCLPSRGLADRRGRNIDGLAFLFASRTSTARCCSGRCKALAANTFAKQLGRAHAQVKSIADMLRSGIHKPTRKRLYGLRGDRSTTRKRRSNAGLRRAQGNPGRVAWHFFEFAERLLEESDRATRAARATWRDHAARVRLAAK